MVKKFSIALLMVFLITAGYLFWFHTETACVFKGGHWASNGSHCITRDCYQDNSCGNWANPIYRCPNVKIGDDISEVYFQLGQPEKVEGNTYTWRAYKVDPGNIKATIINNKLVAIDCNAI